MSTPLFSAIDRLRRQGFSRFHTPGHKGRDCGFLTPVTPWDFTEVRGADSLFEASGPIAETEARCTALYRTGGTFLSAGGSTLCIQAMLALVRPLGGKLLLGRNAHASAIKTMALLDLRPEWLAQDLAPDGFPAPVTPAQVEAALADGGDYAGVYVTSPDYFGRLTDIAGLAEVCHRYGVPLLVDNAHGAELFFTGENRHPMALGADLCCDSLHKTLPVLTGGALLHVGATPLAEKYGFAGRAKEAMGLFGSTSPSYLILLSMDRLLPALENGEMAAALARDAEKVSGLAELAESRGFGLPQGPVLPTRLTLGFGAMGCTEAAFDAALTAHRVEPEYLAGHACVFLCGGASEEDFARLRGLIEELPAGPALPLPDPLPQPETVLSPRAALFARRERVPLAAAGGRISAATVSRCPPGVPLLCPGERITAAALAAAKGYGLEELEVVR